MRIISGKNRSRIIKMVGIETTRETSDKVRGAIFNLITNYNLNDKVILDLFSGSGSMGLEALSRGARYGYFNDINKKAYETTKENIKALKLEKATTVFNSDYHNCLKMLKEKLDFVFLDPPYKMDISKEIIETLNTNELLNEDALIICEVGKETLSQEIKNFEIYKEREYGIKKVIIYRYLNKED